jgi:hypothetical protein
MKCPRCNNELDDDTAFCGNCGAQIAPLEAPGATVASSFEDGGKTIQARTNAAGNWQSAPLPVKQSFSPLAETYVPSPQTPGPNAVTPAPKRGGSPLASTRVRVISALALIVLVGGALGLFAALRNNGGGATLGTHATGQVAFLDNPNSPPGHSDALNISIQKLEAPPSGFQYDAWLVNDASELNIALGTLKASGQNFSLSYAGDGQNGKVPTNLVGAGNKVIVTLEQGSVNAPTGNVILTGAFPPKAFVHIKHLLFSFPITPSKIGLLVGLLGQAQLLNAQSSLLQIAASNHNWSTIQCASQGIIDITEGAQGSDYQHLSASCNALGVSAAGDGFGILGNTGYDLLASEHASLAAVQSDSTDNIRQHAAQVESAMTNIKGWATQVVQDALKLRSSPHNTSLVQDIVNLCDHIYHGVDSNPVQAGAINAYNYGQLMATLSFVPGVQ